MKPLKLEMSAFASYADKQIIDFSLLNDGVFLITGETGAGKTAIFDALMFALYGASSGERNAKELRSHFADSSADTEVKFTFSHNGKTYRAERRYGLNKKGEITTPSAYLYEDYELIQNQSRNVTKRISEIVGLDCDQFKNVIMLAQGEFKKFLTSDTDKKKELLSRLFDSSPYNNFQQILKRANDMLFEERSARFADIKNELDYNLKGDVYDIVLSYDDEDISEKIQKIINKDEAVCEELNSLARAEQAKYNNLFAAHRSAFNLNKSIDEYCEARSVYDRRLEEKPLFEEQKSELERAEKFMRFISPKYQDFVQYRNTLNDALEQCSENERLIADAEKAVEKAQKAADIIPELQNKIEKLSAQIEAVQSSMKKYSELDKLNDELSSVKTREAKVKEHFNSIEKTLKEKNAELIKCEKRLEELKNAEIRKIEAQRECDAARAALDTLNKAAKASKVIFLSEKEIRSASDKIEQAEKIYLEKQKSYTSLYENFLNAKYGVIADEIRSKLKNEQAAICPVCGGSVTRGETKRLALTPENTPAREEVEKADRQKDEAKEAVNKAVQNFKSKEKDFEYQKSEIINLVKPYIPEFTDWQKLTEPGKFNAKLEEFRKNETEASENLRLAIENNEEKNSLIKIKEKLKGEIKESERDYEQARGLLAEMSGKVIKLEALAQSMRETLPFSSSQQARLDIERKTAEKNSLKAQSEKITAALRNAQSARNRLVGKAAALKDNRDRAEEKVKESENILNHTLKKYEYLSVEHALSDIEPIGNDDPEQWIAKRREQIYEYENSLLTARNIERERFAKLADESGNIPEKADINEISARLEAQNAVREEAQNAASSMADTIKIRREAYKKIRRTVEKLNSTSGLYSRLNRLSSTAAGLAGEKYDFERFALSSVFREILEAANVRLNTMSGGRYELVHEVGGNKNKNSKIGFEIEVYDILTDTRRDTKSLSGGETFLTSLALALGLSDVITQKSGGNKVEAMFIDEGFGSLDPRSLDTALNVLLTLSQTDCQIGIISHVDKLRESIPQKIRVYSNENGSRAEIE